MTVEECAISILEQIAPLTLVSPGDGRPQEGYTVVVDKLRALILAESERGAAMLRDGAERCWKVKLLEQSSLLRTYADEILRTSPGKRQDDHGTRHLHSR